MQIFTSLTICLSGGYVFLLNRYLTVKSRGEHEIVIEKSRFICHIQRAVSEEEAQAFIQSIKKQHWNATHNCSAYLIGEHDLIQKRMMMVNQAVQQVCQCLKC